MPTMTPETSSKEGQGARAASRHNTLEVYDQASEENGAEFLDMTEEEESRMLRKFDLHIFPVVMSLYILSFLDRVNIGMPYTPA